jgi:hypothetical protein
MHGYIRDIDRLPILCNAQPETFVTWIYSVVPEAAC